MLKMTKIELELISDSDMYLFLMDRIRGGMTVCNKKYVKADNIYTREQHDIWIDKNIKKKLRTNNSNKYLMYLDANNLYGLSMSKPLPSKNFKFSNVIPSEVSLNENNLKLIFMKLILKLLKICITNLKIFQYVLKLNL